LMLLGVRYYQSFTARFLTRDPELEGDNWYGYARANPLTYYDQRGTTIDILCEDQCRPRHWKTTTSTGTCGAVYFNCAYTGVNIVTTSKDWLECDKMEAAIDWALQN